MHCGFSLLAFVEKHSPNVRPPKRMLRHGDAQSSQADHQLFVVYTQMISPVADVTKAVQSRKGLCPYSPSHCDTVFDLSMVLSLQLDRPSRLTTIVV